MHAVLAFRAMAYNNRWANHRLLGACAKLSQAEFVAPRIDAMEGGTLGMAAFADEEPRKSVSELRIAQGAVDNRLLRSSMA
jgi:hypothetical protein